MRRNDGIFDACMDRRDALRLLAATGAAGLAGLAGTSAANAARLPRKGTRKGKKPNIIFILSDNIQYDDFGFNGHPFIKTPGIDRLAAEGVVFSNGFNTTSLCSPARASVLTGAYARNHGVLNNHTPWTGQKKTFLEYLKDVGYDTAFVGKWHMPGEGLPKMPFLDLFVSYTYREGQGAYLNCPLIVNGVDTPPRKEYLTEELTDRAIEFIEERTQDGETSTPFCLYLSHRAAHPPFVPPQNIRGIYADEEIEMSKEVDPWFSKTNGNVFQGVMMGSYEEQYRKYCEVITAMDRQIGRLVDRVDELGLDENTVIIFSPDNGMMWGEHRCHGIRQPYEEAIRTPFVVRHPGLVSDPGTRREQMALNIDIAPTLLDIAGIPIPDDMDGESFLPILADKDVEGRKAWLIEFWKYFPENTPSYAGVRTETHKYVEYEKTLRPQLFDLEADPKEMNNLYGTPQGDELLPDLKATLEALKRGDRPASGR
jgi:N-acetylglucosamine-6-sulfatase